MAAKDSAACCAACNDKVGCKVGVLFGGECFLKTKAQAVTKYARAGRTSCMPKTNASAITSTATTPAVTEPEVEATQTKIASSLASDLTAGGGGPLRAMLAVAKTSLSLTVTASEATSAPVLHVVSANTTAGTGGGSPCALYVKPTLRNATGFQLGYVSFSTAFVILRPGEAAALSLLSAGPAGAASALSGVTACVEAWNAPRVCVPLP